MKSEIQKPEVCFNSMQGQRAAWQLLEDWAKLTPTKTALISTRIIGFKGGAEYQQFTFSELSQLVDDALFSLQQKGFTSGEKVLLLVPPGLEFVVLTFALMKLGVIVILIDPGMGGRKFQRCVETVAADGIVGVPIALLFKSIYRKTFSSVKKTLAVRKRVFARQTGTKPKAALNLSPESTAMIAFTTGSTGIPKGVVYSHRTISAQINSIRDNFLISENDIGFPAFLPFALYCICLGNTCIMPNINPRKPSKVNSRKMVEIIEKYHPTYSFGSPAFWKVVAGYAATREIVFSSLQKVLMFGAPVRREVLANLKRCLVNDGESYTPYGATEALPVTSITGSELLSMSIKESIQKGVCVGRAFENVNLRVIAITEDPISDIAEICQLPAGEIGEIIVKSDVVTAEYFNLREQTIAAKIRDGNAVWHRMGDVGFLDQDGRLWFCGRKNHRVITADKVFFSVQCEVVFNAHKSVFRSALVPVVIHGQVQPVIIIEKEKGIGSRDEEQIISELLLLAKQYPHTNGIENFLFHPSFPVDFRHNAKILREDLAIWAQKFFSR